MSAHHRPNILLIMTDQQRGDCLGVDGHPVLHTPHLDGLAGSGVRFRKAYTACPVCIPARRTLMTGQKPSSHGVLSNYHTWLHGPTLPELLSRAGYQTHLVGKLHLWPERKLYGFNSADWSDGPYMGSALGDYGIYLEDNGIRIRDACLAHGAGLNSWIGRPWHLEDRFHFSNWCAEMALRFLEKRDPTVPFFLKVSFFHPHPPFTPPQYYFDKYMNMDLPEPAVSEREKVFDSAMRGLDVIARRVALESSVRREWLAGYLGCINHVDHQIGRILYRFDDATARDDWGLSRNTVVIFVSDHGEMLGDHQWMKKSQAYEPSARIPFLMRFPDSLGIDSGQVRDEVVELMDIMPTLLDLAGVPIPDTVDGRSLMPLLHSKTNSWRQYLHGECSHRDETGNGMQYLTDGRWKYVWYPTDGSEQLFDLDADPSEMIDLSSVPEFEEETARWRAILARELTGRPEGFSDGQQLRTLGHATPRYLPGYERENFDWDR